MAKILTTHQSSAEEKLYNALCQLKQAHHDYAKITIKTLCRTANLSRQTFYRHYQTKDDILANRIHNFKLAMLTQFNTAPLTPKIMVTSLVQYWSEHRDFFELIEWANLQPGMIDNIAYMTRQVMINNHVSHIDDDYLVNIYAGSTYYFLRTYLIDHHGRGNTKQIVNLLLKITGNMKFIFT